MASTVRGAKKISQYQRSSKRNADGKRTYTKSAKRLGASRKKAKQPFFFKGIGWLLTVKVMFLAGVIYVVGWQINWSAIQEHLHATVNKPVSNITVKGEFRFLTQKDIRELVMGHVNGNFANIDLVALRESLKTNPWVKTAVVQRVWPDGLQIEVYEQKPIARWGSDGVINNEGVFLSTGGNSHLSDLPLLYGPDSQKKQITRTYLDMTEMLASRDLTLEAVHVDDTLSWRVVLGNNMELIFGQYDVLTKLRNFILVYDQKLSTVSAQVAKIDMRYDGGMAVSWREQSQADLQVSR